MTTAAQKPWGAYPVSGKRKFLHTLVRCGFSRGVLKRWFQRQWKAAGPDQPVDLVYAGLKFRLHPFDNTTEAKMLLASKDRDREELDFLAKFGGNGGAFVDVGANIGFYSLAMLARGAGKALAIEPLPIVFERLRFNIEANQFSDRLFAVQAAVGPEAGSITIKLSGDLGGSSIVRSEIQGEAIQVQMLPLLNILSTNGFTKIDAMKVDVEGFEDAALLPFFQTAPRTLWPRAIVMEDVHRKNWKRDVLAQLAEMGYTLVTRSRSNSFLSLSKS